MVLALWLTRLGVKVRIIDQTAEAGTTSRALALQARTLEFYEQAGFAQQVVDAGVKVAAVNMWTRGVRAARVPLTDIGKGLTPFAFALVYPQDAHERLLIEQLQSLGVQVERRTKLHRFEQTVDGISASLQLPDGSEQSCQASYIAGCDGAHSTVREVLGIGFPGGTYTGLFYVADVQASGPVTDYELHLDLDGADLLIVFPLKQKGSIRLVGDIHDEPMGEKRELTFDDVSKRAIEHMKLKIEKVNWFSTYRVHHRVANQFRSGRAFLLGDAAHIHSPVGGQGMNTGIGDSINLAWKLAAVLKQNADPTLLDSFEIERIAFARRLVATTDRIFTFVTRQGRCAEFVRTRIFPRFAAASFKLAPLRELLFRTVSQTNINYRHGPLSEGIAGSVHGGDRLPWVVTDAGSDNFAPLRSFAWQVHVYGEPHPGIADTCAELSLPLHVFPWQSNMHAVGLKRSATYLIRPDGYVALADPRGDPKRLGEYVRTKPVVADSRAIRPTRDTSHQTAFDTQTFPRV